MKPSEPDDLPAGLSPQAQSQRAEFLHRYQYRMEQRAKISLNILIWGPSQNSDSQVVQKRGEIRHHLIQLGHNAMFSEELPLIDNNATLLAHEHAQAALADLIVVLVEDSPGALGEMHDFGHSLEIAKKLYIMAPHRYKRSYSGLGLLRMLHHACDGVYWYKDSDLVECRVRSKVIRRAEALRELFLWTGASVKKPME